MRRLSVSVVVAVVLMRFFASQAPASISIVADLDSNATNGPDTLQVEPTDTVLVRLWFTGTDSMLSYGVTLGDTSGALSWVEETATAIYNSPSGWTDINVQQDSLGWVLLQATDFAFATPIHAPYEFARLKFFVTAADSCGTLERNLDLCGWFNLDLGTGEFGGFEGPVICVDEVLDGGGGGGGEPDEPDGDAGEGEIDEPAVSGYPCEPDLIEVMFAPHSRVRVRNGILVDLETDALTDVGYLLDTLENYSWTRFTNVPEGTMDEIHSTAVRNMGQALYNMNNAYRLRVPAGTDVWSLSNDLEALSGVLRAFPVPLAPEPPNPPDYEPEQGYLDSSGSSPSGIDAEFAWEFDGGTREGVVVCDIEGCWNYNHTDLAWKAENSQINEDAWCDSTVPGVAIRHGTATIGVLISEPNEWGTTGICYGATLKTCGDIVIDSMIPDTTWNPPDAIYKAIAYLDAGDVILLEEQWVSAGFGIPIEWYGNIYPDTQKTNGVYEGIRQAVANGIIVVEPGGNGNDDTDDLVWLPDTSGAIVVGGGEADTVNDLERWVVPAHGTGSSYGVRFDVQGWAESIYTTGTGDLWGGDSMPDYAYTNNYGGTSGASAMVAGAAAALVGYWKENISETPPLPSDIRRLLKETGTPQVGFPNGPDGAIGPRPNLQRAILAADSIATGVLDPVPRISGIYELSLKPSPMNGAAEVLIDASNAMDVSVGIFGASGRLIKTIYEGRIPEGRSKFEWLGVDGHGRQVASGVYFCRLRSGQSTLVHRVVMVR